MTDTGQETPDDLGILPFTIKGGPRKREGRKRRRAGPKKKRGGAQAREKGPRRQRLNPDFNDGKEGETRSLGKEKTRGIKQER